jgi:hypothetical protein
MLLSVQSGRGDCTYSVHCVHCAAPVSAVQAGITLVTELRGGGVDISSLVSAAFLVEMSQLLAKSA